MVVLLQLLEKLNKFDRELLKIYFEQIKLNDVDNELNQLPKFINDHCGLNVEFNTLQKELLSRVVKNGNWKVAFKLKDGIIT